MGKKKDKKKEKRQARPRRKLSSRASDGSEAASDPKPR